MGLDRPDRVAIIGGGCGAITTAFELSRPEHRGRYDITVYQLGWRLGGKGASGRGVSGRIEEHGLHFWLGFYDNAFRLLRECYAELAEDPGNFDVADWRKSFLSEVDIGLFAQSPRHGWYNWSACFPPQDGLPGDPLPPSGLFSLSHYIGRAINLLRTLLQSIDGRRRGPPSADPGPPTGRGPLGVASLAGDVERIRSAIRGLLGDAASASAAVLVEALAVLQAGLTTLPSPLAGPLTRLAEWIADQARRWLEKNLIAEQRFQHVWEVVDLVLAVVVGTVRFGLLTHPRGLEAIDDYECREWLRLNGASERSVRSPFVRGLYDLALAYEDGDPDRPGLAAGQALRGSLRMFFGYRGALFWRMRAGMGDVVFAPLYEVLRRRGVKFEFFHRLTNVRLAPPESLSPGQRPFVAALEFDVQADIKAAGGFAPLIEVNTRPCWPSVPDYSQLVDGDGLAAAGRDFECHWDTRRVRTKTLEVMKDFDFVVLGVSIGVIPYVCREILARDARWRRMVERVKTVATQSFQIWLNTSLEDLGWNGPPYVGSAFAKPFDTWCDMAHAIPEEAWTRPPKTVIYFCGVLSDPSAPPADRDVGYPERRKQEVRQNAIAYLRQQAPHLWPGAYDARGEFRWDLLMDGGPSAADPRQPRCDVSRFATQYWRANVNPSDRYVLALPGSLQHRISPLDLSYDNLTIAGDWTDCGFNEGCVEAAVMSGMLAAHAIAGVPRLDEIVGYDHP